MTFCVYGVVFSGTPSRSSQTSTVVRSFGSSGMGMNQRIYARPSLQSWAWRVSGFAGVFFFFLFFHGDCYFSICLVWFLKPLKWLHCRNCFKKSQSLYIYHVKYSLQIIIGNIRQLSAVPIFLEKGNFFKFENMKHAFHYLGFDYSPFSTWSFKYSLAASSVEFNVFFMK